MWQDNVFRYITLSSHTPLPILFPFDIYPVAFTASGKKKIKQKPVLYGHRSLGFKFQKFGRHNYAINNRLGSLETASGYEMPRPGAPPGGWERQECRVLRHQGGSGGGALYPGSLG